MEEIIGSEWNYRTFRVEIVGADIYGFHVRHNFDEELSAIHDSYGFPTSRLIQRLFVSEINSSFVQNPDNKWKLYGLHPSTSNLSSTDFAETVMPGLSWTPLSSVDPNELHQSFESSRSKYFILLHLILNPGTPIGCDVAAEIGKYFKFSLK